MFVGRKVKNKPKRVQGWPIKKLFQDRDSNPPWAPMISSRLRKQYLILLYYLNINAILCYLSHFKHHTYMSS